MPRRVRVGPLALFFHWGLLGRWRYGVGRCGCAMQGLIDQRPYGIHAVGHQLNGGVQSGNGCNQRLLHTFAQFSRRVYRPVGRQVQMHGGEVALPRGAGVDHMVKKHFGLVVGIDRFKAFERIVHQLVDFCAGGAVHQPLAGTVNQPPSLRAGC